MTAMPTRIVLILKGTFAIVDRSSNLPIHSSPNSPEGSEMMPVANKFNKNYDITI